MLSETLLTPKKKSSLPKAQRFELTTLHHAGQQTQTHYQLSYSDPPRSVQRHHFLSWTRVNSCSHKGITSAHFTPLSAQCAQLCGSPTEKKDSLRKEELPACWPRTRSQPEVITLLYPLCFSGPPPLAQFAKFY